MRSESGAGILAYKTLDDKKLNAALDFFAESRLRSGIVLNRRYQYHRYKSID